MKHDVLRDAARALREAADESPARPDATRARIMRSLHAQRARRMTVVRTCVALAAVLVGSAAWAAATQRLPSEVYEVAANLGLRERDASEPPRALQSARSSVPRAVEALAPAQPSDEPGAAVNDALVPTTSEPTTSEQRAVTPSDAPSPPVVAPSDAPSPPVVAPSAALLPPVVAPSAAPSPGGAAAPTLAAPVAVVAAPVTTPESKQQNAAKPAGQAAAPEASSEASAPTPSVKGQEAAASAPIDTEAHALYQAAHRAHFAERNPSAALGAWNAYLAAAPRGRFSVEAHYNRALCLVRLGRTGEARAALEPFARGAFGGYRQTEARSLLDAMDGAGR